MIQYPYPLGTVVEYRSCMGTGYETGTVTAFGGPYSVIIDSKVFVPVVLIRPASQEEVA